MGRVAVQMEKKGIPVVLETWDFEDIKGIAQKTFMKEGMPEVRQVFTPPDTALKSVTEFIPEFIDALTRPLTEKEKWSGTYKPPAPPRIAMTETWKEVQAYFEGDLTRFPPDTAPVALMTDGLPVTPPTEELVAEMLTGTSHAPDEIIEISTRGPGPAEVQLTTTVEKVAINAVMAGCKPVYMPVLLAIAGTGACYGSPSDCSCGHMFVVSGPIAKEIGMSAGMSYLCPGNPANMTIERAATLMGINLAGCMITATSIGRMGNHLWGKIFAEKREKSPWEGLNVNEGYRADESALIGWWGNVMLVPACLGNVKSPTDLFEYQNGTPEGLVAALRVPTQNLGSIVLFTPDTAKVWKEQYGFETMRQLQDYLYDNVTWTKGELASHYRFFALKEEAMRNPRGSRRLNPDHLELPGDALVPCIVRGPESIKIIVAGGDGYAWGWGTGWLPVSASIDKWR